MLQGQIGGRDHAESGSVTMKLYVQKRASTRRLSEVSFATSLPDFSTPIPIIGRFIFERDSLAPLMRLVTHSRGAVAPAILESP